MDTDHGSATDEVWFAYRGNLYEVMADAKIAALLKSMLATNIHLRICAERGTPHVPARAYRPVRSWLDKYRYNRRYHL
jgi:hypothetical protein